MSYRKVLQDLPNDSEKGLVNMPEVVAVLQKHLPDDAVLTNGAGNFASWVHRYFKHHGLSKGFKTQLAPTVGAMGYGVPAGIAAAIISNRIAFTIAGDGDFLMNGQEVSDCCSQHGAKSIVVLLNNGMYGTIRMHQEREFPTHIHWARISTIQILQTLAKAYGYEGIRIHQN
jgi:acetolactate synthase I/II/III large subunit